MSSDFIKRKGQQFAAFLEYLFSVWGVMSFGLVLLQLVMLPFYALLNEALQPIASIRVGGPIALVCTFVIAFYMFTLRDIVFKYSRTASFSEKPRKPIYYWALLFFVVAILLGFFLAFGVTTKNQLVSAPGAEMRGTLAYGQFGHMFLKLAMTGCLTFVFVFLALSAGLMAAYNYGKSVDMSGPDAPLYTDEARLQKKVLDAACAELGLGQSPTVSDMKRSGGGGIVLTLHHKGELIEQGDIQFREDKTWTVHANAGGELVKIEEKEVRQSKVEAFQVEAVLDAVAEILGPDEFMTITSMKRSKEGDVTLNLVHQAETWIVKADRWSRLTGIEKKKR